MPDEVANVTCATELRTTQDCLSRALQRRTPNLKQVVVPCLSVREFQRPALDCRNVRDTQRRRDGERVARAGQQSPLTLKLSLIWEHELQILDLAFS